VRFATFQGYVLNPPYNPAHMKGVQELFSWLGRHPIVPHLAASEETIFTNHVIMEEKGGGEWSHVQNRFNRFMFPNWFHIFLYLSPSQELKSDCSVAYIS
jgi:hypothetical protein